MSESDPKPTRRSNGTFTKGNTANRKGAPKKPRDPVVVSAFDVFQSETVTAADGTAVEISPIQARQREIYRAAVKGSRRAQRRVLGWILKRNELRAAKAARARKPAPIKQFVEPDPKNANEALLILQITTLDPVYLQEGHRRPELEPWAVQAALSRGHGVARLHEESIKWVKIQTRDAETIQWPRGYGHSE